MNPTIFRAMQQRSASTSSSTMVNGAPEEFERSSPAANCSPAPFSSTFDTQYLVVLPLTMSESKDQDDVRPTRSTMGAPRAPAPSMTLRARRRREEAVRRLVADVQSGGTSAAADDDKDGAIAAETHDWLVASTVATALEKGLDRDLHSELVQEAKDNAGRIGQICHDHADVFLTSVAKVAALGEPSGDLADGLKDAHQELQYKTAGPMMNASVQWEEACRSYARARTLHVVVQACQQVAVLLERARKQAGLGRPRAALDAVDQARRALATPMESLFLDSSIDPGVFKVAVASAKSAQSADDNDEEEQKDEANRKIVMPSLEQTPFGKRATVMLPKIENEVLMSARRGLNRWFLSLRSGGDQAKVGRAVLRHCAYSVSVGTGQLGLGGYLPSSYVWRAKTADNLISRVDQNGKVARAVRQGYWFDRDAPKEAERLEGLMKMGMGRRAETIAACFGWYRCWDDNESLLVDPSEFTFDGEGSTRSNLSGSRHGLSGSRHGLSGSRHGLRGSRHGRRTLGFRATTSSRSQAFQDISSTLGSGAAVKASGKGSKWADLLIPSVLSDGSSSRKGEDEAFQSLPESVHPVRRAELAFNLLGRSDEFVHYYEQNRFGEMKIGSDNKDEKGDKRSSLSSLTGDDVSVGTDRIFFAKTLPYLNSSVIGFCAVEAALELGNVVDEEQAKSKKTGTGTGSHFRESSERYERALISELGALLRGRAMRATLAELVRSSALMAAFRASLKIVHPSSTNRRHDKDLMALDVDILMTALKIAQDEQLRATGAIVADDPKMPMLVSEVPSMSRAASSKGMTGVPDPEEVGLPFGLSQMKQIPQKADIDFQEQSRTSFNRAGADEAFNFSQSVPVVLRTLHARAIATAAFALTQEELGQKFPEKKGSASAGFVLDCVEECVSVTAVGMKDSENVVEEGSVEKAVQVMANIASLQHCLPRFFGALVRGLCHIGLVRAEELEETFTYAEKTLKAAERACDSQVGSTYSLVYEICRNKIDSHINYALENFNWVAKSVRDVPNAYCEGLIGYLRSVFASLGPMDEGSRAGLHFSCCGHVSERLVKVFAGKPGDTTSIDDSGLPPLTRIDAFGIKNLALDCMEFERFADGLGIPQLRDCFSELKVLTTVILDKELPMLLLPEHEGARRRKYPILSMEKVLNILEKYIGTGLGDKLMGGGGRNNDFLIMDKKEVAQLIKLVRSQGY